MGAGTAPETTSEAKGPQKVQHPTRRRRGPAGAATATGARYFLAKAGSNGVAPVLDREFSTEGEVMIEALKTGQCYFVVTEWRAEADLSGKTPQIQKRPVRDGSTHG